MKNKKDILEIVFTELDRSFADYSWFDRIDNCDLTEEEKKWAGKNIGYKAYIHKKK